MHIGILLCDRDSDRPVGVVEFHPSGVLGFHSLQRGLHVVALKPVERVLSRRVLKTPLCTKYALQIKRNGKLGKPTLKRETRLCAEALNRSRPIMRVGETPVTASVVEYEERET